MPMTRAQMRKSTARTVALLKAIEKKRKARVAKPKPAPKLYTQDQMDSEIIAAQRRGEIRATAKALAEKCRHDFRAFRDFVERMPPETVLVHSFRNPSGRVDTVTIEAAVLKGALAFVQPDMMSARELRAFDKPE